jgi:hypothetical protein
MDTDFQFLLSTFRISAFQKVDAAGFLAHILCMSKKAAAKLSVVAFHQQTDEVIV